MCGKKIVAWVVGCCTALRLSQRKTLGQLVCGAMRCRRVSLADLGRSMQTGALVKHSIKRVYRFLRNHRVEAPAACGALLALAAKAAHWRLVVAVDWVDVGPYKVLRAAVPLRGRSVPVLFAAYSKWQLFRSQNAFEEAFFLLLSSLIAPRCEAVVVADRGFARTDLARRLQELALHYVIRLTPKVIFRSERYHGRLDDLPVRWGIHKDLGFGLYRSSRPVSQRVVVRWKRPYKEPLFLATDLEWGWRKIVDVFALRMMIEELFRDEKNLRYGWGLRQVSLSEPARLERLLLVLAFAYLLLLLMGLRCRQTLSAGHWCSASAGSRKRQMSAFLIGRHMQYRLRFSLRALLQQLDHILAADVEENWG